jgi:hypothetical protein
VGWWRGLQLTYVSLLFIPTTPPPPPPLCLPARQAGDVSAEDMSRAIREIALGVGSSDDEEVCVSAAVRDPRPCVWKGVGRGCS